ncbi:MAG: hypothetical protein IJR99_13840 [Kiritimatiellae bacterium]|nr:hypothetical protein [Kiritimatiellia bacterium]
MLLKKSCWIVFFLSLILSAGTADAKVSKGVWWWRGGDAEHPEVAERRMEFLSKHGVTEIYFWADPKPARHGVIRRFVKMAKAHGMRVACLSGDVSWIRPGSRGFTVTWERYLAYQQAAAPDERFYALHLDVEPHQDDKLDDSRKWQLYADFVLRVGADVHSAGEKIEWDIPFWLDKKRVAYGDRPEAPLLELLLDCSDCLTLMSYRDTAKETLAVSQTEIGMVANAKRKVRIVLGAETGNTGEGSIVTYFEEGAEKMNAELTIVERALEEAKIPGGAGIAIHHLESWEKLVEASSKKETGK